MESYIALFLQSVGVLCHHVQWFVATRIHRTDNFVLFTDLEALMSSFIATRINLCATSVTLKALPLNIPLQLDPMQIPSSRGRLGWPYRAIDPQLFKPDSPPAYGLLLFMPHVLITTLRIWGLAVCPVIFARSAFSQRQRISLYLGNYFSSGLRRLFDRAQFRSQQVALSPVFSMITILHTQACCVESIL